MATSKSSTRKKPVYSKLKKTKNPKWMQVVKIITIILFSMLMLLAIAGMVIKYYKLVTKY